MTKEPQAGRVGPRTDRRVLGRTRRIRGIAADPAAGA